jgi:aminopeptidase-like protein
MAWGECLLRGRTPSEVLISCEIGDPPWRAGDLAGLVVAIALAQRLHCTKTRYSYRLLFMPHSMGSVSWLALNQPSVARIKHSLVIDGAAGPDHPIYSESQLGGAKVDQAVAHVLRDIGGGILADEAHASGCALPGAAPAHLPASTDPGSLHEALMGLLTVIDVLESNCVYVTGSPDNRPEFTNHGLLPLLAGNAGDDYRRALVWVLNLSDGRRTLLDIADQGGFGWDTAKAAARALVTCGLIRPMTQSRAFTAERQPMNRVLN